MTESASTLMDMRLLAAQAVAREAGAIARRRFLDRSFTIGFKGPQDYLTEVDGETEAFIAERLLASLSRRRVHRRGEQGAPRRRGRRRCGSSIRSTAPRISPAACRISASRSPASSTAGSRSASSTIRCSTNCSPPGAAAARDSTARDARRRRVRSPLGGRGRLELARRRRRYVDFLEPGRVDRGFALAHGSGALGLAYVAAGRCDGYVEHHINAWDCLAGILLVSEAGGYVSDFLAGDGLQGAIR